MGWIYCHEFVLAKQIDIKTALARSKIAPKELPKETSGKVHFDINRIAPSLCTLVGPDFELCETLACV